MLAAESDVYRETLKLQLRNLQIYAVQTKRRVTSLSFYSRLILTGLPIAGQIMGGRRSAWKGVWRMAVIGWQLYRKFSSAAGRGRGRQQNGHSEAEEYLSRRI